MIKKIFSRRGAELSAVVGLLCAIFASMAHFEAACDDLRQNVLRLHIIANSDSEEDQAVKLLVRDKILEESTDIFAGETDLKRAEFSRQREIGNHIQMQPALRFKVETVIRLFLCQRC